MTKFKYKKINFPEFFITHDLDFTIKYTEDHLSHTNQQKQIYLLYKNHKALEIRFKKISR